MEGGLDVRPEDALPLEEVRTPESAGGPAVQDDLGRAVALGLQEHWVHRDLWFDARGGGLLRLCAPDLQAVRRHRRVV